MDKLSDLKDLLRHEVEDLYSAGLQIVDVLPGMIGKAGNGHLKIALKQRLDLTGDHRARLEKVQQLLQPVKDKEENNVPRGFLSRLFGGSGTHTCKGMEGLIREGQRMMKENMDPEVMDAVIVACAQKIEHYEICGYGTARAYAKELKLAEVEKLLGDTLNEEYTADDKLTQLAVQGGVNRKAGNTHPSKKISSKKTAAARNTIPPKKTSMGAATKKTAKKSSRKSAPKKSIAR